MSYNVNKVEDFAVSAGENETIKIKIEYIEREGGSFIQSTTTPKMIFDKESAEAFANLIIEELDKL